MENGVLPDFQDFLISNKLAAEKTASYYAFWASKFLKFSNEKGVMPQEDKIEDFLSELRGAEEWQLRQAGKAIYI